MSKVEKIVNKYGGQSGLARKIGVVPSAIAYCVAQGRFTDGIAMKIVKMLGERLDAVV